MFVTVSGRDEWMHRRLKEIETCGGMQKDPSDLIHRVLVIIATVGKELAMGPREIHQYINTR